MKTKLHKSNQQGLTHILFIVVFLAVMVTVGYVGLKRIQSSNADTVGDFTYVATHPQAASQSTVEGKTILTLKPWNGKLYAGYGDYDINTGPISITPFDPTTNTFATTPALVDGTEQIALYRVLNSKLYAPAIDPSYLSLSSYYADSAAGASWVQALVGKSGGLDMEHVFDMNTLNGTDLWAAGSKGIDAVVWHSTDGGTTWTKSLDIVATGYQERFYSIGSFNGKLYVQASRVNSDNTASYPLESSSHVFDGTSWTTGPSLGSSLYYVWHTETFAGKMLYLSFCPCNSTGAGIMYAFVNNAGQSVQAPAGVADFAIDGSTLYTVGQDGNVYSTTDLTTWYLQRSGPTTARSIAVLNGQIYVGTTDSKVYKASVNTSPTVVGSGTTSGGTTGKTHGGSGGGGGHKK
jgi:hypothetical protein